MVTVDHFCAGLVHVGAKLYILGLSTAEFCDCSQWKILSASGGAKGRPARARAPAVKTCALAVPWQLAGRQ